jgi:hypothetical protein
LNNMPPRKAASPAPSARKSASSTPAKSPAASPAPSARKSTGRQSKSPAPADKSKAGSAAAAPQPVDDKPEEVKADAAPKASAAAKAPVASAAVGGEPSWMMYSAAGIAILLSLLAAAAFFPSSPQKGVPRLSLKAFDGTTLKPGSGAYRGSAIVIFTNNKLRDCAPCAEINKLIKSPEFVEQHTRWWSSNTVRVGKVFCDHSPQLCTRFGIIGDDGSAPGVPHILSFEGGKVTRAFENERTLDGFRAFVEANANSGAGSASE